MNSIIQFNHNLIKINNFLHPKKNKGRIGVTEEDAEGCFVLL